MMIFLVGYVTPQDFFDQSSKLPKVLVKHDRQNIYNRLSRPATLIPIPAHKYAGYSHTPMPLRKSFIQDFEKEYPEFLQLIRKHRVRYSQWDEDVIMIYYENWFSKNLIIQTDNSDNFFQFPMGVKFTKELANKLFIKCASPKIKFLNINDHFEDKTRSKSIKMFKKCMDSLFPNKCFFENDHFEDKTRSKSIKMLKKCMDSLFPNKCFFEK